jgi:hypothetical protein
MFAKTTSRDLVLALVLTVSGGAALLAAVHARWNPGDMLPGIEGCVTAGVVGTLLALLQRIEYRTVVAMSAPVVVIEYLACVASGGPAAAVAGMHLAAMGLLGLGLSFREPVAALRADAGSTEASELDASREPARS